MELFQCLHGDNDDGYYGNRFQQQERKERADKGRM